jgi:hypothetical protein
MSWSQTGVFTGTWSFQGLPGAAVDGSNNILVAWFDGNSNLNIFYSTTTGGDSLPAVLSVPGGVQGSPGVIYANGSFYVFWRAGSGQLNYGVIADPSNLSEGFSSTQPLANAFSNDGPQVTLAGGPGQPFPEQCIYVAWRGAGGDEQLYSGFLSNLNGTPHWSGVLPFIGNITMNSWFSPDVGSNQSGYMYSVWKGADSDQNLYFSYSLNFTQPNSYQPIVVLQSANGATLQTDDRPSLGVFSTQGSSGYIVVAFADNGGFYYTIGDYEVLTVSSWANQEQIPTPEVANPMGVLVSPPSLAGPPYLLLGSRDESGYISNVLYLYQYQPD